MKIQVTVEMELSELPDDAARELARDMIEARGLTVSRVSVVKTPDRVKAFIPKAGKPGSVITCNNGIAYVVWSEADDKGYVWATKRDNPDGYYYKVKSRGWAEAYHGSGKRHTFGPSGCSACDKVAVA